MSQTPRTKADAYHEVLEQGEDASLRKQVAAQIATAPMTAIVLVL